MARYIDAEKLKTSLKELPQQERIEYMGIYDVVNSQSTANVQEVKRGKWIKNDCNDCHDTRDTWVSCNLCGHTTTVLFAFSKDYNYCPKCGAKMDKE